MSINFTARFETGTTIPQRLAPRVLIDRGVSIVELDSGSYADMDALREAACDWQERGGKYAVSIYRNADARFKFPDVVQDHFYALTTQNADFHSLKPDGILGLMMFSETRLPENEIVYLETNPSTSKSLNKQREFNQVGRRLVDFVHSKFPQKDILVNSEFNAIKFYKKVGCEQPSKAPEKACQLYLRALK